MRTMKIGKSNITAPRLMLGTFGMGGGTSWQDTTKDDKELVDFIKAAHDELGICALDTAPVYGCGRSERIVGEAIKGKRKEYYISTKCTLHWRNEDGKFEYTRDNTSVYLNFSKASLLQDIKDSLTRIDTDYIDTMIIHRCPPLEQIEEVMDAMHEAKSQGLIRAIGLSNSGLVPYTEEAIDTFEKFGGLDLLQESASLLSRKKMQVYLKKCEQYGITFQTYSALEKGALSGKIIEEVTGWTGDNRSKYKWFQPEGIPKINALTKGLAPIAGKYNCTIPVLCLAWVLAQSECVNLLVGARRMASITDTVKALDIKLDAADIAEMNRLSDIANE